MKIYTAIRFAERPALHMTLKHYGDVKDHDALIEKIAELRQQNSDRMRRFTLHLPNKEVFGYKNKVNVLVPDPTSICLPPWLDAFTSGGTWRAHVTCEDECLTLTACEFAIMCKKDVIRSWTLLPQYNRELF